VPDRYAAWLDRDVLAATGPEAATFLQGQLSQDVLALGDGEGAWSWVLAPTGKVDALVRVVRVSETEWVLDTDAGWGEALLARLNRFKLRTKVSLEMVPWKVLGLRFDSGAEIGPPGDAIEVVTNWPPTLRGVDRLGADPSVPDGWPVASADDYEAKRIVAGLPKMGAELTEKTIPAETGIIDLTVSFTKGCYTGQELVARIDSRGGHVPRHLRGLALPSPVTVGTELVALTAEEQVVGVVSSAAQGAGGDWVGLGYVRRGVEPPAVVRAGRGGPEVEVRELSW
jgi:folate-binding protein YgfZ